MFTDTPIRRLGLVVLLLTACGGGDGGGGNDPPDPPDPPVVIVTPVRDTLTVGTTVQLTAGVTGATNTAVTWSAIGGGTVSSSGLFTAGTAAATALVIATSEADATAKDTATILVVSAPTVTVTAPDSAVQQGLVNATIPSVSGMRYAWTVTGGSITAGQGSPSVSVQAGGGALLTITCTATNLADSALTASVQTVLVPGPTITSFVATRDTLTISEGTTLVPVFDHGLATIDNSIGSVTSGQSIGVGPFQTGYIPVNYTLTVVGFRGIQRTATAKVVAVNPPGLESVRGFENRIPAGGRAKLFANWRVDPGVHATLTPGNQEVPVSGLFSTPVLANPGSYQFTVTVRTPADSTLSRSTTATVVPAAPGSVAPGPMMKEARGSLKTIGLADGRVLVVGGTANGRSAEIYNPQTNQFTYTDSMINPRLDPVVVLATDGRVLVTGSQAQSEWYNPQTGSWQLGPTFPTLPFQMIRLTSGRILSWGVGGLVWLYNPTTDSTTTSASLPSDFWYGLPLPGDRAMLIRLNSSEVRIYDASTGTTSAAASMLQPHFAGAFTKLASGKILAVGGETTFNHDSLAGAEIFDPGTGQWTATGPLAVPRFRLEAVLLSTGKVLIAGGSDASGMASYAELFDEGTGTFTPLLGTLTQAVNGLGAVALPNGQALFSGGWVALQWNGTAVTERFSP